MRPLIGRGDAARRFAAAICAALTAMSAVAPAVAQTTTLPRPKPRPHFEMSRSAGPGVTAAAPAGTSAQTADATEAVPLPEPNSRFALIDEVLRESGIPIPAAAPTAFSMTVDPRANPAVRATEAVAASLTAPVRTTPARSPAPSPTPSPATVETAAAVAPRMEPVRRDTAPPAAAPLAVAPSVAAPSAATPPATKPEAPQTAATTDAPPETPEAAPVTTRPKPKPAVRTATRLAPNGTTKRRTEGPPSSGNRVQESVRAARLDPGDGPACEAALKGNATFTVRDAVRDNSCGAPRPLSVSAVEGVALSSTATLRCPVATAFADWTETVVKPAAKKHFRQDIASYVMGPSYACRTRRNGSRTTRLSEHAFANAVDVAGFKLKDGTVIMVEPNHSGAAKAFQAEVRKGACGPFKTVLGPRTVAYHDDHLHLDSAPRGNGSIYCR